MPEVDNTGNAPVIPAGTEPTVYGKTAYPAQAPAPQEPTGQAPIAVPPQGETPAVETPPTDPSQVVQTPGVEKTITFDELAAKKGFQTPDDLAKSYAQLEKKQTQESMNEADLLAAKSEGQQQVNTAQQPQVQPEMQQDEAVKIVQTMIDKSIAPLREKSAIQATFKNPADMQYAPEVAKLVKSTPGIPWDVALDAVKQRNSSAEGLKEQGKQEAYANIQQKEAGQSDVVQTGTKPETDIAGIVKNKDVPFSEVSKIMRSKYSQ